MSILFANTLQFVNIMLYFMCTVVLSVLKRNLKQHNADYVASRRIRWLFLYDQVHIFHSSAMFRTGGNNINSCCVDTAVTQNVRKFCNILFNAVKCACKQVAKIMRKYLLRIYICIFAQGFHFSPDIRAVYGFAAFRYKNHTAFYPLLCCIAEQFLFQFFHDKNRACFCLAVYNCLATFYRLNRDVL